MESGGSGGSGEVSQEQGLARRYLAELAEETMVRAWGAGASAEDRRRIVLAAAIFGRQFDERFSGEGAAPDEREAQRMLMGLINGVIEEFARVEDLELSSATEFLGNVETRDYVLEFNEALDAYHAETDDPESGRTLNEQFERVIDERRERAVWSGHWSSG